ELIGQLEKNTLSQERIDSIIEFAKELQLGVKWADMNPKDRRELLIALQVKVIVTQIDEGIEIAASCVLDSRKLNYNEF
ncbi:MAG: hypothetical protein KDJ65_18855, partial [Anaerolineae bacterium]|nr:hypothetical protein [Anaerolineae bacterium]